MNALRFPITLCAALAVFAGCGGSKPPIGAPGAMPPSRAIVQDAARGKSWMQPVAKGQDLLYISSPIRSEVDVFTYPQTRLVDRLRGLSVASGLCSDKAGDVWVVTQDESGIGTLVEFAHGAETPIATLNIPGSRPSGCAVDPSTGDLAVGHSNDEVSVYSNAQGSPTTYSDLTFTHLDSCSYDSQGNLFAYGLGNSTAYAFAELGSGASSFTDLFVAKDIREPTFVQWDGKHIAVAGLQNGGATDPENIYRITVSGSKVKVIGTTTLQPSHKFGMYGWIGSHQVIQPDASGSIANFYHYPKGGAPQRQLTKPHGVGLQGVTVSFAPR